MEKFCSKCFVKFPVEMFSKEKKNKGGLKAQCKNCDREYRNRIKNSKEFKEKMKDYRIRNRERLLHMGREYRKRNREELLVSAREYKRENRDKMSEYQRVYREKNKEKRSNYLKNKFRDDPKYRIEILLRQRFRSTVSKKHKYCSAIRLLGCTVDEFKIYLESKFKEGMTWENHGKYGWHIDHIKPCAFFDLTNPEQQKICFHYTNLQPLWAIENLKKLDRMENGEFGRKIKGSVVEN
jgi:hypothetical protein